MVRDGLPNEFPPVGDMVEWVRLSGIDPTSRIVLYDTGMGLEAARAFVALNYMGLGDQAAILDGHWKGWTTCFPKTGPFLARLFYVC